MRLLVSAACLLVGLASARLACASGVVEIEISDGRVLRGLVDTRTDDARLWVRQDDGPVSLAASAAWDDVVAATIGGQAITSSELHDRLTAAASVAPRWFDVAEIPLAPIPTTWTGSYGVAPRARVRSIEIVEACLVNLDRDIEPDGLIVSVAAIDDRGNPVPVRGSLTARLLGERRPVDKSLVDFGELDRWSEPVAIHDFIDGVATYELKFRRTAPEHQFDLLPDAVLDVQLGAYGEGNFAATAPVVVRQFNPLRDNQQLYAHSRFFAGELSGRNPISAPRRRDGLWLHWTR